MTKSALSPAATAFAAAVAAAVLFSIAAIGFAWPLAEYAHASMPVSLLGAVGVPRAGAFNVLAFVVPGLLMAWSALGLRARVGDGWRVRVGATLWLLSALAFVAQGVWPLAPADIDGEISQLHATMWSLWWIAFVPGAVLLALGARGHANARKAAAVAWASGALVLLFAALPPLLLPGPLGQRVALLAWFAAYALVARLRA